jgi:hypothetical protein
MKILLPLLLSLPALFSLQNDAQNSDLIFRALKDEMKRSTEDLKLDEYKSPYYLAYTIKEQDKFTTAASFGALCQKDRYCTRNLKVDLRVGDYSFDSSNFGGSGGLLGLMKMSDNLSGTSITAEDNYDAIRHELWLRTDEAYKRALESLLAKKTFLKANPIKDLPASFSKEEAVVTLAPRAQLKVDEGKAAELVKNLSRIFKKYPSIQKSIVSLNAQANTRWYLNNEGSLNRVPKTELKLSTVAAAVTKDGTIIGDSENLCLENESELPSQAVLASRIESFAQRLTKITQAPEIEPYRGPVLFTKEASASFFAGALQANLGNVPEGLNKNNPMSALGRNPLADKIGTRILPKFISIIDDPLSQSFDNQKLLSSYPVDEEGVKAQKITLVENGFLKTLAMNRTPCKDFKQSNGHARGSCGFAGNLFIQSQVAMPYVRLKEKLLELGREDGLKYVYIIEKLSDASCAIFEERPLMNTFLDIMGSGSEVSLSSPLLVYKVSTETGNEELVRAGKFGRLTLRVLRDIEATGNDSMVYQASPMGNLFQLTSSSSTIASPSLLIKEIELQRPQEGSNLPPILSNPFFRR